MFQKEIFQSEKFYVCLIVAAAFLVTLPILIDGIPYGFDMPHHFQCALTYLDAIKSGDFYPAWTLDRNLGYGAMELRMYPPLSHYVLALFEIIVGNWLLATWLTYFFWWTLGSCGVYLLSREFVKPNAAAFAAILFSVMPYRLSQLYLTFLYSELCAIAVLPFCFYFLTRILKESADASRSCEANKRDFLSHDVLGLTVSYAVLILTHLPMTVIGSVSLAIYFFAQVRWNFKSFQFALLRTAVGLSAGLAATSFFWIKVIQERFLLAKNAIYEDASVNYQYNFLLTALQNYDDVSIEVYKTITQVYDAVLFLIFFVVLPVALLGLFAWKARKNSLRRGVWTTFISTAFLTTILSRPLWNNLPLLSEVQFPWRFLGVVSIFAPVIAAFGFSVLLNWFRDSKRRPLALIIAGTILVGSFFAVNQSIRGAIYKDSAELENYVESAGKSEGFTFWWTIWARKDFTKKPIDKIFADSRQANISEWKPAKRTFNVEAGKPLDVYVATFYHPNWSATVNDVPTEIRSADDGGMLVPISDQNSTVNLAFQETSGVRIGKWFSALVWFGILLFILMLIKQKFLASKFNYQLQCQ